MTYRELARENAKRFEGLRLKPYKDTRGIWTIGYGFNLESHKMVKEGKPTIGLCTLAEAEAWLDAELAVAEKAARHIYRNFETFPDVVKAICIDLAYNLGQGSLSKFVNTNAALDAGRWTDAARGLEKSRYYQQTGRRAKEHVATLMGLSRA